MSKQWLLIIIIIIIAVPLKVKFMKWYGSRKSKNKGSDFNDKSY